MWWWSGIDWGWRAFTHRVCGLRDVSAPSVCPGLSAVGLCGARPQPLVGSHALHKGRLLPPLQVFQLALAHFPLVSCYCFFVRAGLASDRQAPWVAAASAQPG